MSNVIGELAVIRGFNAIVLSLRPDGTPAPIPFHTAVLLGF